MDNFNDYWIKDINLAEKGSKAVHETLRDMPGLVELEKRYASKKPLSGARVTGCVLVTYETAAFILLLQKLGAQLRWCPDNRFASLDDACALVASHQIPIFAKQGMSEEEYFWAFEQALQFKDGQGNFLGPNLVIDDGCDITRYIHDKQPELYESIIGTCEQTTCGMNFHYNLKKQGRLKTAVMNVNESVTKAKFDNIYGSRESLIEGLQKSINIQLGGKKIVIFGFGEVGKGCAKVMRGVGAQVFIVEIDPIMAMQAHMEGYMVVSKKQAYALGEIFISATGCIKTINGQDIEMMKDGAILANMGHGNMEINTQYLNTNKKLTKQKVNEFVDKYIFPDGRSVYLLSEGYLINLRAGNGHPPRVMSITFTNHILALMEFVKNPARYQKGEIYRMPREFDEEAARLNFPELQEKLNELTKEQADYLGVSIKGPFKREDYRY